MEAMKQSALDIGQPLIKCQHIFSDRKALDDIVFDVLGLTEDERDEVYWAVCELVPSKERVRSGRLLECCKKSI